MGWKNVKEYYRIGHIVQVASEGICIGSGYCPELIIVGMDGTIKKRYEDRFGQNEDLARYQSEMEADPTKLRELIEAPDTFEKSVTVFTYCRGEIIEKVCEEIGWPNVTHDGEIMYENMFFVDKSEAVDRAKNDAQLGVKFAEESVGDAQKRLAESVERLDRAKGDLARIEADYPA